MRLLILSTLLCFTFNLSSQILNSDIRFVWRIEQAESFFNDEPFTDEYTMVFGASQFAGAPAAYDFCVFFDGEESGSTTGFSQFPQVVETWGFGDPFFLSTQAWEDDGGERCEFDDGDDQFYFGWSPISGGTIPETSGPSRRMTNAGSGCFGEDLTPPTSLWDFCYSVTWRHLAGDETNDPLIFNSNFSSGGKTHFNSNIDLDGVGTALKYANTYGESSPDVYYAFTLDEDYANVVITTDYDDTNFDTKIYLLQNGNIIEENDDIDEDNLQSRIERSLCAGSYQVIVEGFDVNTGDFRIGVDASGFVGPLETSTSLTNATCSNANDGTVTANASFGVPPYTYQLFGPDGLSLPFEDGTYSELEAGSFYFYTVTDACGASVDSENFTVSVFDNIDPVAVCVGATLTLNDDDVDIMLTAGEISQLIGQSTDNCGIESGEIFPNTISASDGPVFSYELTVYDTMGNSGSALCELNIAVVTSVSQSEVLNAALSTYPNPTNGLLQIKISDLPIRSGQIFLRDQIGKPVLQRSIQNSPSNHTETLDLTGLPAGVYTLQLQTPDGQLTRRIVKQ